MIIRPGALGDTLMLMPALIDLRGKAAVTFVGREPGLQFVKPYIHLAVDMEGAGWHRLFSEPPHREGLPVAGSDLVVAFFRDESGSIRRNLKYHFSGAPVRVFPSYPEPESVAHEAHYLAACLSSAGLPVDPEQAMTRAESSPLLAVEKSLGKPYLVFHPGSGSVEKNLPPEFWLELIKRGRRGMGAGPVDLHILLGPAEEDVYPAFTQCCVEGGVTLLSCPRNDSLLPLLGNASLFVGHDSGITHLAAMTGVPTVALFKTTDPNRWSPIGPKVSVIKINPGNDESIDKILRLAEIHDKI